MILLLETSSPVCSVALVHEGKIISSRESKQPNQHAEKITVFCDEVLKEAGCSFPQLDAVAVSEGPGSYTGLRIGVSTAKGICYAVKKPLITIPTLEAMADAMRNEAGEKNLLCPMIDARRMEVYCAVYDFNLEETQPVSPVVLDENSFAELLKTNKVFFSGDGMPKAKTLLSKSTHAHFTEAGNASAKNLARLAEKKYAQKDFSDLAYFEPFYLKVFHPGPLRSKSEE